MKRIFIMVMLAFVVLSSDMFSQQDGVSTQKVGEVVSKEFRMKIDTLLKKIEFYSDFNQSYDAVSRRVMMYNDKIKQSDLDAVKVQIDIEKYKRQIQDLFATQFTEEETNELLRIFESPVYRKLQKAGDALLSQIRGISEGYMVEVYESLYKMLNRKKYEVPAFIQSTIDMIETEKEMKKINSDEQK